MSAFTEYLGYCLDVGWVEWEKPRRHAHCFVRIWRRSDSQMAIMCTHRHRTAKEAIRCGKKMLRKGKADPQFDVWRD